MTITAAPVSKTERPSGAEGGDVILSARRLAKEYSGFRAVDGVDLDVRRGSIHALIGPNGAGKTSCFNLLTKFVAPTSGTIAFDGVDITKSSPAQVSRAGLVRSFQISSVFPTFSVVENVVVALQQKHGVSRQFWRSGSALRQLEERAVAIVESVGLSAFALARAESLPYGRERVLEFATTLALEPKLMLLDEPMAGVGQEDIERLSELIRRAAVGRTVLMVEHNLSVVSSLSDRVTVLARGKVLAEGNYASVSADPRVIEAYIGSEHG